MTIDYKHTLNLPKTEFAMKANLAQREPEQLKIWQEKQQTALCEIHGSASETLEQGIPPC